MSATRPHQAPQGRQDSQDLQNRLVELREQGGFAGLDNRVIVAADGRAKFSRRTGPVVDLPLTSEELTELRGHLAKLRIGPSEAQPQGADFIAYTLTYQGRRATRYTLPADWQPVVRFLEEALEKYWAPD
ncbi:hypothetical protein ABGB18_36910 [Nonomuraea sp. B12E4]|uniref:hypothetical protein n=1 Tax=Nonomuraea sp. B12E4 TaxID=3153564 RepID=UPI00325D7FF3